MSDIEVTTELYHNGLMLLHLKDGELAVVVSVDYEDALKEAV